MMKQNNKNLDLAKLPKGLNKKQFLALPEMKNTRTIFLWTGIVEIIAGVFCLSRVAYFRFMIIPLIVDIVLGIIEIKKKSPDIAIIIVVESVIMGVVSTIFGGYIPNILILILALVGAINFNKMWKAYSQIQTGAGTGLRQDNQTAFAYQRNAGVYVERPENGKGLTRPAEFEEDVTRRPGMENDLTKPAGFANSTTKGKENVRNSVNYAENKNSMAKQQMRPNSFVKQYAIWMVFIAMIIIFGVKDPMLFRSYDAIALQIPSIGIAAVGMTFVIVIGGIDFSVGSVILFAEFFFSWLMVYHNVPVLPAALLTLAGAVLIGLLNGFMITTIRIPAMIATLATQTIFTGVTYQFTGGNPITNEFSSGFGFPLYGGVFIMILCFLAGWMILNKTSLGGNCYAIGENEKAAELSDIRHSRTKYIAYVLSGFFSGLSGIIMFYTYGGTSVFFNSGYESIIIITCVVLGGVSVMGGTGRISGVIAGVFIVGFLISGLNLIEVTNYLQMIITGIILALAVGIDCILREHQTV